jgi:hypothetical protein
MTGGDSGVADGPFRPMVSPLGLRHPVTEGLTGWQPPAPPAWGEWYRHVLVGDVQGQTVLTAPSANGDDPLLVLDHVGEGRVALLLSDQIWLWSRGHEGGGPQAELLRRVAHWLMKEPELEENALTAEIRNGHLSIERRTTDETSVPTTVTVTDPDGGKRQQVLTADGPGRGVANLSADVPGVWQVTDGTRTAYAASGAANPLEIADLRATATRLLPLVHASMGGVHWLDPAGAPTLRRTEAGREASGADWIGLRRNHDHLVTGIAARPLLPPWIALPLMLGLAVVAWRREGAS